MALDDPRLLDHDPLTGITEWYHYDPETDGFVIQTQQDLDYLIEVNTALWNDTEKSTHYGELTRVASIPNVVMMELSKQGIVTPAGRILDDARFRRWLNSSENRAFRVRAGTV